MPFFTLASAINMASTSTPLSKQSNHLSSSSSYNTNASQAGLEKVNIDDDDEKEVEEEQVHTNLPYA